MNPHELLTGQEQKDYFYNLYNESESKYYHNVSIDVVILGYHERSLKVLLQKPHFSSEWMLPGGFILRNQTVEQAAAQVVSDRTRLKDLSLYQFKVFSQPKRNQGMTDKIISDFEQVGIKPPKDFWMFDDFMSICFFALTEYSLVKPSGDYYSEECTWFDISDLPGLLYDHREMIDEAMRSLRHHVYFQPIGYSLLPEKFTLPEIHSLYETILDRKLDERNFAKKLINLGLIVKLKEQRKIGAHRSPYLYIFDKNKYDSLLKENDVVIL